MFYTKAELIRMAKTGDYEMKLIFQSEGDLSVGDKHQFKPVYNAPALKMVGATASGIEYKTPSGKKAKLPLPAASLLEVCDSTIIVYAPRLRELTNEEKAAVAQWKRSQADMKLAYDMNERYAWSSVKRAFFRDKGFEYLLGEKEQGGKKYSWKHQGVLDSSIKGYKKYIFEYGKVNKEHIPTEEEKQTAYVAYVQQVAATLRLDKGYAPNVMDFSAWCQQMYGAATA